VKWKRRMLFRLSRTVVLGLDVFPTSLLPGQTPDMDRWHPMISLLESIQAKWSLLTRSCLVASARGKLGNGTLAQYLLQCQ
jgi:hypothetical protein